MAFTVVMIIVALLGTIGVFSHSCGQVNVTSYTLKSKEPCDGCRYFEVTQSVSERADIVIFTSADSLAAQKICDELNRGIE